MRIGISWISLFSLSVLFRFSWLMANGNICEAFRTVSVVKRWLVSCGIDRSRVSCRMRHTGRRISTLSPWSWTILECPIFLCEHYFHVPSSADCVPSGLKYNLIVRTREWVWERERERERERGGGGGEISDISRQRATIWNVLFAQHRFQTMPVNVSSFISSLLRSPLPFFFSWHSIAKDYTRPLLLIEASDGS